MTERALTTTHGGGQVTTVDPAAAFDTFIRRRVARGNPSQDTIDGYAARRPGWACGRRTLRAWRWRGQEQRVRRSEIG